ncbi:hypothetical protein MGYG_08486 [Nannizzia gypsea CBS 118893]|uniref:Uncharacterized protein n=1 Tax=Arthroderma gypseum (strain ATCC MYA-4604 / CBS 118893) TaxID=535722 RepID=E4V5U8_ARTGP|nr:hypothetical protein MGYG_08486 [Nannizzia gypsea CBS 118893]EFR05473.1 hypothetical protein MGYG_08486 [Nannizzia gypsea CBS 118893]
MPQGILGYLSASRIANGFQHLLPNSSLTEEFDYASGAADGHGQIILFWRDQCPKLPPVLADLPIFSLKESEYDPNNFVLENDTLGIRSGVNPDTVNFGTIGFIITLDTGLETKHAIGTVGHVLGDTGRTLYVNIDGIPVTLTTVNQFERIGGRPVARSRWRIYRSALDEICLLDIPSTIADIPLPCVLGEVNCHAILGLSPGAHAIRSPSTIDPDGLREWLRVNGPLLSTEGLLTNTREDTHGHSQVLPRPTLAGWSSSLSSSLSSMGSSLSTPEQGESRTFYMSVKWTAPDDPFSAPGDSGRLVFALSDNNFVPLGIPYGADGDVSRKLRLYSTVMHTFATRLNAS